MSIKKSAILFFAVGKLINYAVFGCKSKYLSCKGAEKNVSIFTLPLNSANLLEIKLTLKTDFLIVHIAYQTI